LQIASVAGRQTAEQKLYGVLGVVERTACRLIVLSLSNAHSNRAAEKRQKSNICRLIYPPYFRDPHLEEAGQFEKFNIDIWLTKVTSPP
jgi:hypothetical protein